MNHQNTKIEYETHGKYGSGQILVTPEGERVIKISWRNKKLLTIDSKQVDLEKSKCNELNEALEKACQNTNFLPVFLKEEIKGPKALINLFSRPNKPNEGYATISKPKTKTLRFSLGRINLKEMCEDSAKAALQKVAFVTGKIKLLN